MRTDTNQIHRAFSPCVPELASVIVVDEDEVTAHLRMQRALLASLTLRAQSAQFELDRIDAQSDDEFVDVDLTIIGNETELLEELNARIDEVRARAELDLIAARLEAAALLVQARQEAADILAGAADSLDMLACVLRDQTEVAEPPSDVVLVLADESVEPVPVARPLEVGPEVLPVVQLLSEDELTDFLDDLEASIAARFDARPLEPAPSAPTVAVVTPAPAEPASMPTSASVAAGERPSRWTRSFRRPDRSPFTLGFFVVALSVVLLSLAVVST